MGVLRRIDWGDHSEPTTTHQCELIVRLNGYVALAVHRRHRDVGLANPNRLKSVDVDGQITNSVSWQLFSTSHQSLRLVLYCRTIGGHKTLGQRMPELALSRSGPRIELSRSPAAVAAPSTTGKKTCCELSNQDTYSPFIFYETCGATFGVISKRYFLMLSCHVYADHFLFVSYVEFTVCKRWHSPA